MFKNSKYNLVIKSLTMASLLFGFSPVFAKISDDPNTQVLSQSMKKANRGNNSNSSPNSSVILDFSVADGESWDAKDKPNNVVANCLNGASITGFEYNDVTIKTVGGSFFSEAVIYFSDSNNDNDGLRLSTGAGDESSGTKSFSSNGILDLTDNGLEDIESLSDGVFLLQLYEYIDDIENGIDARYTDGTVTVWGNDLVPTNNCPFIAQGGNTDSDLSVEYTTSQTSTYNLNDSIEFNITVDNVGEAAATNVTIDNYFSNSITVNGMSCDDGTSSSDVSEIMTIGVQDITAGDTLVCLIDATIVGYGYIQNSVSVNASNDNNPDNDDASLNVNGVIRVIPINNLFALILLSLVLLIVARKKLV